MKAYPIKLSAVVFALTLVACGCEKKEAAGNSGNGNAAAPAKKLKLAFVSNNAANFWSYARAGCDAAAKELGDVDVDFRITPDGSSAAQRQILDDLVAKGVDGVAVSVNDPNNQTDFLNKIAGQTLLVCSDSDAASSKRVAYIGTDNQAAGEEAGKMIRDCLPNGGKIMLFVGLSDSQNAVERAGGIKKSLEGSNIQIIDIRTDDAEAVRAQKNAEDTLVKYPDIACLVGLWNYNGPAILNAVRGAGKTGAVKIVCFDDEADTLAGIASGDIYGTVVQNPFEFGWQSVTRMEKYLQGDKTQLNGKMFMNGKMFIPTRDIKKDNVANYQAGLKKILGN
jgi:ribose transport system substrate-binding protein